MKKCPFCDAEIADDALFCKECGAKLPDEQPANEVATAPEMVAEPEATTTETSADTEFAKLVSEVENKVATEPTEGEIKAKKKNKRLKVVIAILLVIVAGLLGIFAAQIYSFWKANYATEETVDYVAKASKKSDFPLHVYSDTTGAIGDTAIPSELIEVSYLDQINSIVYTTSYYDSYYGEGYGAMFTGYDSTVSASKQTTTDDDNNVISFDEYFYNNAVSEIEEIVYLYNTGKAEGYTLSDDDIEDINDAVTSIVDGTSGASIDTYQYLTTKGLSAKEAAAAIAQYYYLISYADAYSTYAQENVEVSDEDIDAYIAEHKDEFKVVDVYVISTATDDMDDAAAYVAECEEKAVDFESFKEIALGDVFGIAEEDFEDGCLSKGTQRTTITSYIDEETAEWMFSEERKSGDCLVVDMTENGGFYIFCIATPIYESNENLPSIRVIPIYDSNGEQTSEELKATADECVEKFNSGDKTEESFIALVSEYSCDSSTTANEGLMENLERGQYLTSIEDWAYDESRQQGDITTIELSNGGYCVMYYIGAEHTAAYSSASETLKSEAADSLTTAWEDAYTGTYIIDDAIASEVRSKLLAFADSILVTVESVVEEDATDSYEEDVTNTYEEGTTAA